MDELESAINASFGYDRFRPKQREVIKHLLERRHTFAILPAGAGKSLCYQLPAMLLPGLTLVIRPQIEFLQEEVDALDRRGVRNATAFGNSLSAEEIERKCAEIESGQYKMVYLSPERFGSPVVEQMIRRIDLSLVVIDDAHCLCQWGHDYRPQYRALFQRFPELRRGVCLALTSIATPEVLADVEAALDLPDPARVTADFNRPNLRLESIQIEHPEDRKRTLAELLGKEGGATIVYTSTRKEATEVYQFLSARDPEVELYHAGLAFEERAAVEEKFLHDRTRTVVATVAFGRGLNKNNIRRIIHFSLPSSLEHYYIEASRAGRDGDPAVCALLYWRGDLRTQRFLIDQAFPDAGVIGRVFNALGTGRSQAVSAGEIAHACGVFEITAQTALGLLVEQGWARITSEGGYAAAQSLGAEFHLDEQPLQERRQRANDRLRRMVDFASGTGCRRAALLEYFGQPFEPPCGACDACEDRGSALSVTSSSPATEASDQAARTILRAAIELGGRYDRAFAAEFLAGSKRRRILEAEVDLLSLYGALRVHGQDRLLSWIDALIAQKYLGVTTEEYPRVRITEEGTARLAQPEWLALTGFLAELAAEPPLASNDSPVGAPVGAMDDLSQGSAISREDLIARLDRWRSVKASALNVAPFVVLPDAVLLNILERQPRDLRELAEIKGFGAGKLEQFGPEILEILQAIRDARLPRDLRLQIEVWRQGGEEPDVKLLVEKLGQSQQTNSEELFVVINTLSDLGVKAAGDELLNLLKQTTDGNLLMVLADALGKFGLAAATPYLIRLLEDERSGVRRAAVRGLGRLKAREALRRLELLARNETIESIRIAAEAAVWRIRNS
jgi:ATP-dependent DNA helicase RecQ